MKRSTMLKTLCLTSMVSGLYAGGDIGAVVPVQMENVYVPVEEAVIETPVVVEEFSNLPTVTEEAPVQEVVSTPTVTIVEEPKVAESVVPKKSEPKTENSNYYVVLKGLSIAGEKLGALDADQGLGLGLDLGYRLGNGFSTELDVAYAKNDLTTGSKNEVSYKTAGVNLVYDFDLTKAFGLFAKAGYMYEKANVSGDKDSDTGLVYGAGLAYKLSQNRSIVGEYEASEIDSLRGDSISLGLMMNF